MSESLCQRDLRALMAVVEEGRRDEPTEALPWAVLHGLAGLIRCDRVTFVHNDLAHGHFVFAQSFEDGVQRLRLGAPYRPDHVWWEYFKEFMPYRYPLCSGDLISVVRISDFYTPAQLHNTPFFAEFMAGERVNNYGLHAFLPTLPGHFCKVSFFRDSGYDFTERDRLIVQLLRPQLYEVYLDAQRRRHHVPQLSQREWEVLQLVDQGISNSDIARELFISVATVRKHLEHIFDRTGARTRTAAAALMMPHFSATRSDHATMRRLTSSPSP